MSLGRWASPVAVAIAFVCVLTATLWYTGQIGVCPHDPVFFFLLPVAFVSFRYGAAPALVTALASFACADYFLYQPLYTLDICSRAELGDLTFFSVLAVLSVKAISEVVRPSANHRSPRSATSSAICSDPAPLQNSKIDR